MRPGDVSSQLRLDAARADVLRATGEAPGSLILGAAPLAASPARALTELRRTMPGPIVTLVVTEREAVVRGVASGELHLGLVDGIAAPSDPLRLFDSGAQHTTDTLTLLALVASGHGLAVLPRSAPSSATRAGITAVAVQ